MPTQKNIKRPFTLIGNGRSGTSLVSKLFNAHPDCFFAGETVNLIHGVWRSLECSLPASRHGDIPETLRKQFLHLFPSKQRYWMQKPIGIPIIAGTFPEEEQFYEWYWSVVTETFPEARFFTVLRHPLDVLISSDQWWDYGMPAIVESNRKIAKLLTHPDSPVEIAVNYHELIRSPQLEVTRLFSLMEMPEHERCMTVFDHGHVLNPETSELAVATPAGQSPAVVAERRRHGFSHRDRWKEIDRKVLTEAYRDAVEQCWEKYGFSFGAWE